MEIEERCNAIEECYEFMLAYAAQGLPNDQGSSSGGQIREFLNRAVTALNGLAESWATVVRNEGLEPAEKYQAFFDVLNRDARDSLAAIELVLVQPGISSQLIDNLNASIHLRALLTDLFLVDELLKVQREPADPARPNPQTDEMRSVPPAVAGGSYRLNPDPPAGGTDSVTMLAER